MIRQFFFALSFLTILPGFFSEYPKDTLSRSAAFFPLVGAILGLFSLILDSLLTNFFTPATSSAFILLFLFISTAGMHLDGFADTLDGLGTILKQGRQKALKAMQDSRCGSFGAAGLSLLLLLKYSLLSNLPQEIRMEGLFFMPVVSRWILVLTGKFFPFAYSINGLGQQFASQITQREVLMATFWVLFVLFTGTSISCRDGFFTFTTGLISLSTVLMGGFLLALFLVRCFGGITGDTLGAVNEVSEVLFLLSLEFFFCLV